MTIAGLCYVELLRTLIGKAKTKLAQVSASHVQHVRHSLYSVFEPATGPILLAIVPQLGLVAVHAQLPGQTLHLPPTIVYTKMLPQ